MILHCIIVDDEEGSHYVLRKYIDNVNNIVVDATFYNAIEARAYLKTHDVDVIFLDINMPDEDGFTMLDQLDGTNCVVIFTTAYSHFALKAFEYNAIDYLHKPIPFDRFKTALKKAQNWCDILAKKGKASHIQIRSDGRIISLKTTEIIYIESLGNYIKIHTPLKNHLALMTLNEIQEHLPEKFIQIYKSYIINIDFITGLTNTEVYLNKKHLPIGRTYKQHFFQSMKKKI